MTNYDFTLLEEIQQTVKDCTKKPEIFLSVQENLSESFKKVTKNLYDLAAKTKPLENSKSNALPELIVQDFDAEQIWQQLELKNNEEFSRLSIQKISKALASKKQSSWELPLKVKKNDELGEPEDDSGDEDDEIEDLKITQADEEHEEEESESKKSKKSVTIAGKKRKKGCVVDDKFFKLDDLNKFLINEEQKESRSEKKVEESDDDDDDEEEEIDLFNDMSEEDEADDDEEEDEEEGIKNGKSVKYADFFDSPESDDNENANYGERDGDGELDEDKDDDSENEFKFNNDDESDEHEQDDEENHWPEDEGRDQTTKSTLEARKERLQKRIEQLEGEAISEKPWQLKGEVSATNRPQNSLLEEWVEFDQVSRPAPIMTEQTTMKLEDIIRKRIKDKAWDDVEKKFKPVETPMEYKKKLIMNQEKSKESLAQIYENEYIKQREALNAGDNEEKEKEESPEEKEIRKDIHSLFRKLDALTNFHYTPKQAKPEIKIVSNIPAISMEEVAPVATSEATLLAPEEIQAKQKGDLIGKSERTKTDMKRERRKKKLKQHVKAVHQNKQSVENTRQKKSLNDKLKSKKLKGRNIIDDDTTVDKKSIKSSTAFFAHLQDQVESSIKAKTGKTTSKKNKSTISAVKLKL